MAEQGTRELGATDGMDHADHRRTYDGFLRLLKYCLAAILVVLVLLAYFLT